MNEDYIKKFEEAKERIIRAENSNELEEIKREVLGKQGFLTQLLRSLGKLPQEERIKLGRLVNEWKEVLEKLYEEKEKELKYKTLQNKLHQEKIDITLPGRKKISRKNYTP